MTTGRVDVSVVVPTFREVENIPKRRACSVADDRKGGRREGC